MYCDPHSVTSLPCARPADGHEHFLPWEGWAYRTSGWGGRRLLVLGESHYDWGAGQDRPTLTQEIVEAYASGHINHQFWNRVTRICGGETNAPGRRRFWDRVAYCVFVQTMLRKGTRPTHAMWEGSVPIFEGTLRSLEPDCLLVLGKELWFAMPAGTPAPDLRLRHPARWYASAGRRVLSSYVNHPRSHGFGVHRWRPVVDALLHRRDATP